MNLKSLVTGVAISSALLLSSNQLNAAAQRDFTYSLENSRISTETRKDPGLLYKTVIEFAASSALLYYIIRKKQQKTPNTPDN